jgi:hypothetical protein
MGVKQGKGTPKMNPSTGAGPLTGSSKGLYAPSNRRLTFQASPSMRYVLTHSVHFDGCFEKRVTREKRPSLG